MIFQQTICKSFIYFLTHPICHRCARNLCKVITTLLKIITTIMIVNCFKRFPTLNLHATTEICQSQVTAFLRHISFAECKCANRHSCFFKCRVLELNQRFNRCIRIQIFPHLLITLNEHPHIRCQECTETICQGHCGAFDYKCREHIALIIRIIILDKVVELCIHLAHSSIGRIRAGHPILPCHCLANINEPIQLLGGIFHTHAVHADLTVSVLRCHKSAQQIPVVALHIQDRAILLGIGQGVQQAFQLHLGGVLLNIIHPCAEILQVRTVNAVALLNSIDMAAVFTI